MMNPITTVTGLIVLIGSIAYILQQAFAGTLAPEDLLALLGVAAGAGLVGARDAKPPKDTAP